MEATEKRRKSEQNQDTCWIIRPKRMRNGHVGGSVDLGGRQKSAFHFGPLFCGCGGSGASKKLAAGEAGATVCDGVSIGVEVNRPSGKPH
jgi:hypothetical protein